MTNPNDFNEDKDDFTASGEGANAGDASGVEGTAGDPNSAEVSDSTGPTGSSNSTGPTGSSDSADSSDPTVASDSSSSASAGADEGRNGDSEAEADLPQLLRQVSRALRREFRSAAADNGFSPRDFGRLRRGRRRWDGDEVAPDGAPYSDEPGTFGPPWARGNWGPSKNIDPEEMRQRLRDLRDSVGERVEDVLSSEEFEHLKASLSKIADAFGADSCEDDHGRNHDHDHDRGPVDPHGDHDRGGAHAHDDDQNHRDHDRRRSSGRGRRGFGPSFGPRIGPGLGAGRRGFDPFGWVDERRSREQEIQDAFERGFAAGFEQGRNS